jgi:hypothetical protein
MTAAVPVAVAEVCLDDGAIASFEDPTEVAQRPCVPWTECRPGCGT